MKVKVIKSFKDLKEDKKREVDEVFEVTQERFTQINSTRFGKLVKKVIERKPKKADKK